MNENHGGIRALTPDQQRQLQALVQQERWAEGYAFVHDAIKDHPDIPQGVKNWFGMAGPINAGTAREGHAGFISNYVRSATAHAGTDVGQLITPAEFQGASNGLARPLLEKIAGEGRVPLDVVRRDIDKAVEKLPIKPNGFPGAVGMRPLPIPLPDIYPAQAFGWFTGMPTDLEYDTSHLFGDPSVSGWRDFRNEAPDYIEALGNAFPALAIDTVMPPDADWRDTYVRDLSFSPSLLVSPVLSELGISGRVPDRAAGTPEEAQRRANWEKFKGMFVDSPEVGRKVGLAGAYIEDGPGKGKTYLVSTGGVTPLNGATVTTLTPQEAARRWAARRWQGRVPPFRTEPPRPRRGLLPPPQTEPSRRPRNLLPPPQTDVP